MSLHQGQNHHLYATAHAEYQLALRDGLLCRPTHCEECGNEPKRPARRVAGHHEDYAKPLEVRWLCTGCHRKVHSDGSSLATISVRCDAAWKRLVRSQVKLSGLTMQAVCTQAVNEYLAEAFHVAI